MHSKTSRAAKKTEHFGTLSPSSRGLDIAGLPIKKLSFNASTLREAETPRKPFAQIMPGNTVSSTPVQSISKDTEEENKTPKTFAESKDTDDGDGSSHHLHLFNLPMFEIVEQIM